MKKTFETTTTTGQRLNTTSWGKSVVDFLS
jgi:hypothetical protein